VERGTGWSGVREFGHVTRSTESERRPHTHCGCLYRRNADFGVQNTEHLDAAMWNSQCRQVSNAEQSTLARRRVSPEQCRSRCDSFRPSDRSRRPSPVTYMHTPYAAATIGTTLTVPSLVVYQPPLVCTCSSGTRTAHWRTTERTISTQSARSRSQPSFARTFSTATARVSFCVRRSLLDEGRGALTVRAVNLHPPTALVHPRRRRPLRRVLELCNHIAPR
jgi:hypothetical protein